MVESQSPNNPAPGLSPSSSSFVGRQREMGELRSALEESLAGQGRLAMLVGEPGIGKTRTAQELASYAETRGMQVLWGRCYEEEGAPPILALSAVHPVLCSATRRRATAVRRWDPAPLTSQKSFPKYAAN